MHPWIELLFAYRESLAHLRITKPILSEYEVKAVAQMRKGLKTMHLHVGHVIENFASIWEFVGGSLQELTLQQPTEGQLGFLSIAENCKNLHSLNVSSIDRSSHEELESLYTSIGGKLKSLTLIRYDVDTTRLSRIVSDCKIISVNFKEYEGCSAASLCELGAHARHAYIGSKSFDDSGHDIQSLREVGKRCENLTRIDVFEEFPAL